MQSISSGFSNALSSSPRKSFHGEGSLAPGVSSGIGKLFRPHVREQVPVYRVGGSILRKPLPFALGQGRTIEKPFLRKAALLKHFFELAKFLRSGIVAMTLGHTPRSEERRVGKERKSRV